MPTLDLGVRITHFQKEHCCILLLIDFQASCSWFKANKLNSSLYDEVQKSMLEHSNQLPSSASLMHLMPFCDAHLHLISSHPGISFFPILSSKQLNLGAFACLNPGVNSAAPRSNAHKSQVVSRSVASLNSRDRATYGEHKKPQTKVFFAVNLLSARIPPLRDLFLLSNFSHSVKCRGEVSCNLDVWIAIPNHVRNDEPQSLSISIVSTMLVIGDVSSTTGRFAAFHRFLPVAGSLGSWERAILVRALKRTTRQGWSSF